jgi:hypothetical protein
MLKQQDLHMGRSTHSSYEVAQRVALTGGAEVESRKPGRIWKEPRLASRVGVDARSDISIVGLTSRG